MQPTAPATIDERVGNDHPTEQGKTLFDRQGLHLDPTLPQQNPI